METAKQWDVNRRETLKEIFADKSLIDSLSQDEFKIYEKEYIRVAETRLTQLRQREDKRQGKVPVNSADIRKKFVNLVHHIRRKGRFSRSASYIEHHFNQEQRRILYDILDEIEENIPWKFPWWEAYEKAHEVELARRS